MQDPLNLNSRSLRIKLIVLGLILACCAGMLILAVLAPSEPVPGGRAPAPPEPGQATPASTLAAADNLAAIAAEGVPLGGERGEALPYLITILYTLRERCIQAQLTPVLAGLAIEPGEIAAVLETIAEVMVSDGVREMAGVNASWFKDAARVVEMMGQRPDLADKEKEL